MDYPRIACPPNTNGAASTDWSVVADYAYINIPTVTHDIIITPIAVTMFKQIFIRNGSIGGLCKINQPGNRFPVVSYDDQYHGLMVGWICEYDQVSSTYLHSAIFNDISPVAVVCNVCGLPE